MTDVVQEETDLAIGPRAIEAYSRLNYTMWHALAEFIDNSTQSRLNYDAIIDGVLAAEGTPLVVTIEHDKVNRQLIIRDNSIGMTKDDLLAGLRIGEPTKDSRGRSKYGMGMKTAACWIGKHWQIVTAEWTSGVEWTADVNVPEIVAGRRKVVLTPRSVGSDAHHTEVRIGQLNRRIRKETDDNIRNFLGSMYRMDLRSGRLKIVFDNVAILPPEDLEFDKDAEGKDLRHEIDTVIGDRRVTGWFGVLKSGGRRFGGFSIFQNERQIQGYPNAWKPRRIYGGEDAEGANNLVAQRLTGELVLDGFEVSHTKDAIDFQGNEEEELIEHLEERTRDFRKYAQKRRGPRATPWSKEKIQDLVRDMKKEFDSPEFRDALVNTILPPLETILQSNAKRVSEATEDELIHTFEPLPDLRVRVYWQERSEFDPHLTIAPSSDLNTLSVLINGLHSYYCSLESADAVDEMIRQYLYDAISEYKVSKQRAQINADSVRRLKHTLLDARVVRIENNASAESEAVAPNPTDTDNESPPTS